MGGSSNDRLGAGWTYLTNHGHVLICLAEDPEVRLRDVAARVQITERSVQLIVGDLERCGAITRRRIGRRNRYLIRREAPLRHPLLDGVTVGDLIAIRERHQAGSQGDLRT